MVTRSEITAEDLGLVRVARRPKVIRTTVVYKLPENFEKGLLPPGVGGFLGVDAIYHFSNSVRVYSGLNGDEKSSHFHLTLSMNPMGLDSKPYWELSLSGEDHNSGDGEIVLLRKSFLETIGISELSPDYLARHWQNPAKYILDNIRLRLEDDFFRGGPLNRSLFDDYSKRH